MSLEWVDELRLNRDLEGQTLIVRTGVPEAVTCYRIAIVDMTVPGQNCVIVRNTSCRERSDPQVAFFVGSVARDASIHPNQISSRQSLRFETESGQLTTSLVLPAGICLVPEEGVAEKYHAILERMQKSFPSRQLWHETSGFSAWERALAITTLAQLPEEYLAQGIRQVVAAQQSGDLASFFKALERQRALSQLHAIANKDSC